MQKTLKRSAAGILAIMSLVIVVFAFAAVNKAYAVDLQPPVSMWIDPPINNFTTSTLSVGDKFNVTVWINTHNTTLDVPIYVWQLTIGFDASVLTCTNVSYTAGTTSQFFQGLGIVPVIPDIKNGSLLFGESLIGTAEKSGNGSLCTIEFKVLSQPNATTPTVTSNLNFTGVPIVDTFVLTSNLDNVLPFTAYNATFNYSLPPADTTPPTIGTVTRNPSGAVSENQSVTVTANITDNVGLKNATLSYTTNNSTWTNVAMSNGGSGNSYNGTIPGQLNGTAVWYYITAFDNAGNNASTLSSPYSYSYTVIPEFTIAIVFVMLAILAGAMIVYRKKLVRLP